MYTDRILSQKRKEKKIMKNQQQEKIMERTIAKTFQKKREYRRNLLWKYF